jgi:IS30 family transposase
MVDLSRFTKIAIALTRVTHKTAQAVSNAMIFLLTPFAACLHIMTTDNGREFAQYGRIAKRLGADFFFAHPGSSYCRSAAPIRI